MWWDRHIHGGVGFRKEIDRQLDGAKVVVVLWSATSLDSEFVCDEAQQARDQNKLIPVCIDHALPPLGFRQTQALDFNDWDGDLRGRSFASLVDSVRHFLNEGAGVVPAPAIQAAAKRGRWGVPNARVLAAVAILVVVGGAALGIALTSERSAKTTGPTTARFAILPFDSLSGDPQARYFADGLADQIATTLTRNHIEVVSRDDALALRGPERSALIDRLGVAMLLDGTVQKDGDAIKVRTHIEDPVRHAIVYSSAFDGSAAQGGDLQARVATKIVYVLGCSSRALRPDNGLHDPALLTHYLRACDVVANDDDISLKPTAMLEALANLRAVTVAAPNFVPALTDLAVRESWFADTFPDQRAAMREEAAEAARRALALDPKAPEAYAAQAFLLPRSRFAEREQLLRAGIAADPSWSNTYGYLSNMLGDVGRTREAVTAAQVAASTDLQIDWSQIAALLPAKYGGPTAPCIDVFTTLMIGSPSNSSATALLLCRIWAGQLDEAVRIVQSNDAPFAGTPLGEALAATVVAMKTGSEADRGKADSAWHAIAAASPNFLLSAVQALASMGEPDAAFALIDEWQSPAAIDTQDTSLLFWRSTESMRRDPRFMKLAARIGLVDYWQTTGYWPDFCADPKLPYDCHAEATHAMQP